MSERQPREASDRQPRAEEEADEVRAEDVGESAVAGSRAEREGEHRADDEETRAGQQRPAAVARDRLGGRVSVSRVHPSDYPQPVTAAHPSAATVTPSRPALGLRASERRSEPSGAPPARGRSA